MDQNSIERIRSTTFPQIRKGYDPAQVDDFLTKVADWLENGGPDEARAEIVKREIDRIGETTSTILSSAEDAAQKLRGDAEREVASMLDRAQADATQARTEADGYAAATRLEIDEYADRLRSQTDAYASSTRDDADAYSAKVREDAETEAERKQVVADQRAAETIEAAEEKARRIVNDGTKRRREIEAVIADLVKHRDEVIAGVNVLSGELRTVTTGHIPGEGADPFERPHELDPLERGEVEPAADGGDPSATAVAQPAQT